MSSKPVVRPASAQRRAVLAAYCASAGSIGDDAESPALVLAVARERSTTSATRLGAGDASEVDRGAGRRRGELLDLYRDPRRRRPGAGDQRDGRHHPHQPRTGALAATSRAAAGLAAGLRAARARPRDRPARATRHARRGPPRRPDRRGGRARHQQQRGGGRPRGRLGGSRRGVVVSRGELVEIGGGVRIPEIIRRAGATLIEVGTTNRTRAADFEAPLARRIAPAPCCASIRRTSRCRASSRTPDAAAVAGPGPRARRDRHRRPWVRGACSTPGASGCPTSRRRASGWPPAPTSSRSAATSSSAGRRPGSSSAAPT